MQVSKGGWAETPSSLIQSSVQRTARETLEAVVCNLRLAEYGYGNVIIRWFQSDPEAYWDQKRRLAEQDRALVILNVIPFNPQMMGYSVSPEAVCNPMVIWIRSDLSVPGKAFVIAHECRHTWHRLERNEWNKEETDANNYALRAPLGHDLQASIAQWWDEQPLVKLD